MLYQLCDWEHNGRDDSDWYAVAYDSETDTLKRYETGTTRFANALNVGPSMEKVVPPDILVKAKTTLARMVLPIMTEQEKTRVEQPALEDVHTGMQLKFASDHKCMVKECQSEDCRKCGGSGKWVNPRNDADKRECFTCHGKGKIQTNFTRKKNAEGKQEWHSLTIGTVGRVVKTMTFGTFYANGYNKPGRHNTTIILQLEDGREVQAPLAKLRLHEEARDMTENAKTWAERGNFYTLFATASVGARFV